MHILPQAAVIGRRLLCTKSNGKSLGRSRSNIGGRGGEGYAVRSQRRELDTSVVFLLIHAIAATAAALEVIASRRCTR